jgi:hypothetical protein
VQDDLIDITTYNFTLSKEIFDGTSLPEMNLCVQNALLRGQEAMAFNKLSRQAQQVCKNWHLEVNSQHAAKMKGLIQCSKEFSCMEEFWGIHTYLSEVTDTNSTARKAKRQIDVAQSHTNYHLSMVAEELVGVVSLDEPIDIMHPMTYKIVGSLMLRTVLLNYLKMKDGYPMIAEVHQEDLCKPTHVIVPQPEEAERMIGMMNKNLPAFLYHILLELDVTEDIVKSLLKKSCEESLVADILNCKWQSDVRTLTTLAEERQEKAEKDLKSTAWFKDEFGLLKKGPKTQPHIPPEEQFNLNGTSLVKTTHDQHQVSILKNASNAPKKGIEEKSTSLTKRMTPMNQRNEMREKLTSPT